MRARDSTLALLLCSMVGCSTNATVVETDGTRIRGTVERSDEDSVVLHDLRQREHRRDLGPFCVEEAARALQRTVRPLVSPDGQLLAIGVSF